MQLVTLVKCNRCVTSCSIFVLNLCWSLVKINDHLVKYKSPLHNLLTLVENLILNLPIQIYLDLSSNYYIAGCYKIRMAEQAGENFISQYPCNMFPNKCQHKVILAKHLQRRSIKRHLNLSACHDISNSSLCIHKYVYCTCLLNALSMVLRSLLVKISMIYLRTTKNKTFN